MAPGSKMTPENELLYFLVSPGISPPARPLSGFKRLTGVLIL
jgi:hypothetical protein